MKNTGVVLLLIVTLICSSCVQQGKYKDVLAQRDDLLAQRDTLLSRNERNESAMSELQEYIDEIAMSLDSIAYLESILFLPDPENPKKALSKQVIRMRLEAFQELVDRQQLRIQDLEDSLNINNTNLRSIKSLLGHMQDQIDAKNVQIESIKKELEAKNVDIRNLRRTITSMESDMSNLHQQNRAQEEILIAQNDMMNEAYFLMGTKKELVSWGAMTGGKASSNPDLNNFIKVDIRYFTELQIPSSRPKILTSMPAESYTMEKNSDGTTTLLISDPAEFWKASKILTIQLR